MGSALFHVPNDNRRTKVSAEVECPECAAKIALQEDVMKGEIVTCGECGMELEVVAGNPWSVTPAPEEEEDWGE